MEGIVKSSLPSFIQNIQLHPVLNRPTAGRFIERKTITCLSQERSHSTTVVPGSANYNNLSTRSQLTALGVGINGVASKSIVNGQSFLQQIPVPNQARASSTIGNMPSIKTRELAKNASSIIENTSHKFRTITTTTTH